jgi:hypothetical protein
MCPPFPASWARVALALITIPKLWELPRTIDLQGPKGERRPSSGADTTPPAFAKCLHHCTQQLRVTIPVNIPRNPTGWVMR